MKLNGDAEQSIVGKKVGEEWGMVCKGGQTGPIGRHKPDQRPVGPMRIMGCEVGIAW